MELEILQVAEDAFDYGYTVLRRFPKSEKFTLAADIKREMSLIISLILRANKIRNKRPDYLLKLDCELDVLRSLVRISHRQQFLPNKQYEVFSKHIDEIGRRLGGWIKKPY